MRVCDADGEERVFAIVGEDEADAAVGKVSWVSPLASALLGARVDDVVTWRRPNGSADLEILSIDYPSPACNLSVARGRFRFVNVHRVYDLLIRGFRRRRMNRFVETFRPTAETTVLDVGGTPYN